MKATYHRSIKTLFSFSFMQKHFLQTLSSAATATLSPLRTTSNSSSFTIQFLVNSCGLPLNSALSASQKLLLDENKIDNAHVVLHFLKSHHFNDTQIANLIKKRPCFLRCRVESNLKPKFDFLVENGFAGNLLHQLIQSHPDISRISLHSNIKPSFEFLKSYLDTNANILVALKRCPWLLNLNFNWKGTVQATIDLLIKEGLPPDQLARLIISFPRCLPHNHDWMAYGVNAIKNLGLEPGATVFIRALAVRLQMSDTTWKKKIEVLKSLGWSAEEVLETFKRHPHLLACSEKKIRTAMDFFMDIVELDREVIFAYPNLLSFSVEKRIRPRFNVMNLLKSKKLIKGGKVFPSLLTLFTVSEKKFLEKYVVKYADDVPGLLKVYIGTDNSKKKQDN